MKSLVSRLNKISRAIQANVFDEWLDVFIKEKGIDLDKVFTVRGPSGTNRVPYGVVIEHMKIAPKHEQRQLKNMLVKLDFRNSSIEKYLEHLGKAIAK